MKKTLLLTGADGFLGTHLTRTFAGEGWAVHGLVRNPQAKRLPAELSGCFDYSLAAGPSAEAMELRPDVVIHAAFQTRGAAAEGDGDVNLRAVELLVEWFARQQGAFLVFISSMSAHDGAYSSYGRNKRRIERALDLHTALAVRPGFVIGPGGIFQRLARTLSKTRIAPMPYGGGLPIQTADVAELCRALVQLSEARTTGLYSFGEETPVPVREFYAAIAAWMGRTLTLVPVPGAPLLPLVRIVESMGLPLPLTTENLLGLKGLVYQPTGPMIEKLGWRPSAVFEILKRYDSRIVLG